MNIHDRLVIVDDEEGRLWACTLEHKCSEFVCKLDTYREIPKKLEELSAHERVNCKRFIGDTL